MVEDIVFSGKIYIGYSIKLVIGMINFVSMRRMKVREGGEVLYELCVVIYREKLVSVYGIYLGLVCLFKKC